jgi:hypothetical protein
MTELVRKLNNPISAALGLTFASIGKRKSAEVVNAIRLMRAGRLRAGFLAGGPGEARFICEKFHKVAEALILRASRSFHPWLRARLQVAAASAAATLPATPGNRPPDKGENRHQDDDRGGDGLGVGRHQTGSMKRSGNAWQA